MKERKLRPLRTPAPVVVRMDDEGRPVTVEEGGANARETGGGDRPRTVLQIRESWRIDDEWWRKPISRLYFEVVLENGKRTVLYRDLAEGGWYRQGG